MLPSFAKVVGDKKIELQGTDYIKKKGHKYLWLISAFWWDTHIPKSYFKNNKNVSADKISKKVNYYDKETFERRKDNYRKCCKIIK